MASAPFAPPNYSHTRPSRSHRVCPHCGSQEIHRSHARGIIERHIVRAFRFYPHRCEACDRRFYLQLSGQDLH